MRIDVWSDVVCPWCYLGKRRMERAVAQLGWNDDDAAVVRWRAFQLDPSAPREPGDLRATIERKYGPGAFDGMTARLGVLGAAEGIDYRFDLAKRVNTLDAHRLVAWAWHEGGAGVQDRLMERLFSAYFERGEDVADHAALVAAAGEVGLDTATAGEVLADARFSEEVAADQAEALERQITGVPAFVVADRLVIPGAQEVDTLVRLLERARERLVPAAVTVDGDADGEACAVDDPHC